MNNKIVRHAAILALALLLLMVFSTAWHNAAPTHSVQTPCEEMTCALCLFGDMLLKVVLPSAVSVFVIICCKTVIEEACSVAVKTSARSFPMLC